MKPAVWIKQMQGTLAFSKLDVFKPKPIFPLLLPASKIPTATLL